MAYEFVIDLVDVGEVSEDIRGFRAQRKGLVTGMTAITPAAKLVRALTLQTIATTSGEKVPQLRDPYPTLPGIVCINRTARLIGDKGACELIFDYGVPTVENAQPSETAPAQIEVGATVQEVETGLDINGNIITVTFLPELQPGEVGPPSPIVQGGTVRKQIPSVYFRYSRREPRSPGDKAKFFVGTMNAQTIFGADPPKYWLCTGITGRSNDFGKSYEVVYEFLRNEDTWDAVVVYIDPATGRIPTTVSSTNGLAKHTVYRSTNFLDLNI